MIKNIIISFSVAATVFAPSAHAINAIMFGDSITQGYQRTQQGGRPYACGTQDLGRRGSSCGYADELTSLLTRAGYPSRLYNWGWHGEAVTFDNVPGREYTFSSGVDRFRRTIDRVRNQVTHVFLMEGTNDLPRGVSSEQIRDGLQAMITYSKSRGVTPVIATLPPRLDARRNDAKLLQVNNYIRQLAVTNNIALADQYTALGGLSGFSQFDSGDLLHVSNTGYQRMAQEWFNALGLPFITRGGPVQKSDIIPMLVTPILLED